MNALGAPFHVEFESGCLQFLPYRFDESGYILVARFLRGTEFLAYHVIHVVLKILQREIFEFAFQFIQAQLMCQRSIQIGSLLTHLMARLVVGVVLYLSHQSHSVGYHYEYHSHVLGKRQEQIAEVFALHHGILLIQFADAQQTM